jgi:murein DD-endopeptidase MepM/ murein hydrolase activator NlpD
MSTDSSHHRKEKEKYTILLVPGSKSEKQKSFVVSKLGLILIAISIVVSISFIVFGVLVYTPVGNYLPITSPVLENRYGKQVVSIQQKLNSLLEEIIVLRQYNQQLRKALGEKVFNSDTTSTHEVAKSMSDNKFDSKNKEVLESETVETKPLFKEDQSGYSHDLSNVAGMRVQKSYESEMGIAELPFSKPVEGFFSQVYNPESGHLGIDIAGKEGSAVLAAAPGTVIFSDWLYDYGFTIMIAHENGFLTMYKHNQALLKSEGENVKRGEPIAILGNTGKKSSGPHLHFEIWKNGYSVDPKEYLLTSK